MRRASRRTRRQSEPALVRAAHAEPGEANEVNEQHREGLVHQRGPSVQNDPVT
jgi:hypothetical protein